MKMPNFQETVPVEVAVKPGHTQQQIRSFTDTMCPQSRVIFHIGVVAHTSNGLIVKLVLEVWLFGRICHLISQLVWVHWRFHTLCLKIPMDFKPTTTTPGILWPSEASRVSVIVQGGYCCSLQKFDRNCSFPVSQCTYLCLPFLLIVNMYDCEHVCLFLDGTRRADGGRYVTASPTLKVDMLPYCDNI